METDQVYKYKIRINNYINRPSLHLFCLSFAIIYQLPDWPYIFERVYGYPMPDRDIYASMIDNLDLNIFYVFEYTPLMYITQEWSWQSAIAFAYGRLGLSPDQIFTFITTITLWRMAYEVASRSRILYTPLLLNPLIVDFAFSQLRLALAIAILSFVWGGRNGRILTFFVYVACMTLHTSVVLFAFMHYCARRFGLNSLSNLLILIGTGIVISATTGPLRDFILISIGDRRAEYVDMSNSISYLSFWILLFFILLIRWKKTTSTLDGRYSIVVLSIVVSNVAFGGYSSRFLAAAFPSLVLTMTYFRFRSINFAVIGLIFYSIIQWAYWLRVI